MPALLIAHRGGAALAPENSRAALLRALEAGAAAVELDARAAQDDLLVLLHDPTPERMTGDRRACATTPARELILQRLIERPSEELLLLDEALELLVGHTLIDLELKPDPEVPVERLGRLALEALERAGSPREIIVTSRSVDLLAWLAREAPLLRRGLIYGSAETRDALQAAREAGAELVVANAGRIDRGFAGALETSGIELWAYTINDEEQARRLIDLGVGGLVTDDEQALGRALGVACRAVQENASPAGRSGRESGGRSFLALDLGSTRIKAALIDPARGITALLSHPTPTARSAAGEVTHDPSKVLDATHALIEELSRRGGAPPIAAGIASQRSTALWATAGNAEPLTPALSWRDPRGEEVVDRLAARREELERAAGLPLLAAWSAIKGAWLREERDLPRTALLTPLGAWVAGRLCNTLPFVDPGLANRTFLLDADSTRWSPLLLDALGLFEDQLPRLVPTVGLLGEIDWPGGGRVPLRTLCGDQQAAYAGAVGPLGEGPLLNLGTAGFLMRSAGPGERPADPRLRRAPLWSSTRRPRPRHFLLEVPLLGGALRALQGPSLARQIALGETAPIELAKACAEARDLLGGCRGMLRLAGGHSRSPQLRQLLARRLDQPLELAPDVEATLLGAARLAAAGAGIAWTLGQRGGPGDGALRQGVN